MTGQKEVNEEKKAEKKGGGEEEEGKLSLTGRTDGQRSLQTLKCKIK